jgi:DNA-binding NarL/FixJ family response regulator
VTVRLPTAVGQCLIVDDNPEFAAAARSLLERQGMTIVGVATTGAGALRDYQKLRPEVTLVDVDLGQESGFAVAEQLHRACAEPSPVILISSYDEAEWADLIAASPAAGFLHKFALNADNIRDVVKNSVGVQKSDDR